MTPTIGRTVHFVKLNGFHAPAVITSVYAGEAVNLSVFMDKTIDTDNQGQPLPPLVQHQAVPYDPTMQRGTWHWPEREG